MINHRPRRVLTAPEVEDVARAGEREMAFDPEMTIVTPLARERANDLGVVLLARRAPVNGSWRPAPDASIDAADISPHLVSEVLRRIQRRMAR